MLPNRTLPTRTHAPIQFALELSPLQQFASSHTQSVHSPLAPTQQTRPPSPLTGTPKVPVFAFVTDEISYTNPNPQVILDSVWHTSGSRQGHAQYSGAVTTEGCGWPDKLHDTTTDHTTKIRVFATNVL